MEGRNGDHDHDQLEEEKGRRCGLRREKADMSREGGDEAYGPVSVVTADWHPVDGRADGWMGGSKGGGVSDGQKEPLQPWGPSFQSYE